MFTRAQRITIKINQKRMVSFSPLINNKSKQRFKALVHPKSEAFAEANSCVKFTLNS